MDITETLAPTSDQLDAVDLLGGPRIFTVTETSRGNAEQPVNVHLAEFPRVWRPGKSMRRVLAACWGTDSKQWTGRKVELYCDPDVMFGKDKVGGTRISRLSHIDGPKRIPLLVSRGKAASFTVQPLPVDAAPSVDWRALIDAATTPDECRGIWSQAAEAGALTDELKAAITARVDSLKPATDERVDDFIEGEQA